MDFRRQASEALGGCERGSAEEQTKHPGALVRSEVSKHDILMMIPNYDPNDIPVNPYKSL